MTSVGVMASAVNASPGADVLLEPFNNLTAWTQTGTPTIVAGRTGTAASVGGATAMLVYPIPAPSQSDTDVFGFAYQTNSLGTTHNVASFTRSGAYEVRILVNTAGQLSVERSNTTQLFLTSSVIVINTWAYIEMQIFSHDTAGTMVLRVNGVEVANVVSIDTRQAGTPNEVRLWSGVASMTNLYDDLYITTGVGAPFKGSITIP